jgi:hypothetical protein
MRCYHDSSLKKAGYKIELVNSGTNQSKTINDPCDTAYYARVDGNDVELNFKEQLRVVYMNKRPESLYLQVNSLSPNTTVQISVLGLQEPIVIEENGIFLRPI